jgi:predicted protein tyrosine phosphatase
MSTITNISMNALRTGNYPRWSECVLIQLTDPCYEPPMPAQGHFIASHHFEFLDDEPGEDEGLNEFMITTQQAESIASVLRDALENNHNVIVHCHAGICRSGAVAQAGEMIGFNRIPSHTIEPNIYVKRMIMQNL